jgi:hypothetical protein
MVVDDQRHAPAAFLQGKRPITYCTGDCMGLSAVWTGTKNFAPTGIRSLNRRARSESQYQLRHAGQFCNNLCIPPVE